MTSFSEIVERAQRETTIPQIYGERCVHSVMEQAGCRACVQICPAQAWLLDDDSLRLDTQACDGCGLCAPVCPQAAIVHQHEPAKQQWKGRSLVFFACEYTGLPATGPGLISCLHAVGERDLLRLYRDGYRHLIVANADCDACKRFRETGLDDAVERVNHMLSSRDLPRISVRVLPHGKWRSMLLTAKRSEKSYERDRRNFLRRALRTGFEEGIKTTGLMQPNREQVSAPATLLPRVTNQDVMSFVPVIDVQRCNGCDACVRMCPQAAMVLQENANAASYVMRAEQCTGCGICRDVCEQKAVDVERLQAQSQHQVPLTSFLCRICGAPYHVPSERLQEDAVCRVCAKVNHYKNLYQVLA